MVTEAAVSGSGRGWCPPGLLIHALVSLPPPLPPVSLSRPYPSCFCFISLPHPWHNQFWCSLCSGFCPPLLPRPLPISASTSQEGREPDLSSREHLPAFHSHSVHFLPGHPDLRLRMRMAASQQPSTSSKKPYPTTRPWSAPTHPCPPTAEPHCPWVCTQTWTSQAEASPTPHLPATLWAMNPSQAWVPNPKPTSLRAA